MTIRITTINEFRRTTIKIDGRLQAVDVDELLKELSQVANMVAMDLSDLKSVDREAVTFLRGLIAQGVELQAATPYVELLLSISPGPI